MEKVKNIAAYSKLVFLSGGYSVTFSDSSRTKNPVSFGIMEILRAYYEEEWQVSVSTESYRTRRREDKIAYLIDFVPKAQNKNRFEMTVQF